MQKQAKIGRADINRHASRAAAGLVLGAASLQPATAQTDSQPQVASTQQADDIVVTASRVNRSGFQAPTPTTILSADAIRDTGATNIGALSINLPQMTSPVGPANSSTVSGGGGQSFNLRALGSQRTLFLVDSHRHVPSTSSGLVDTNIVPSAIVERIEVVTGGASAAWGSDAIAGVVNVILRKDFQGLEAEALRGGSTRGDADELKLALTYGTSFGGGRGNIMIAGEYEDNDGVAKQSDRPWSKGRWGIVNNPQYTPTNGQFARIISKNVFANNQTPGGLILTGALAGTQFGPGGTPMSFNPGQYPVGAARTIGGDGPAPQQDLAILVPLERYTVYGRGSYDFSDNLTGYVEASFAKSTTEFDLVDNFHPGGFAISSDNAFLPASIRTALTAAGQTTFQMGRIDTDFGPIHELARNRTYRVVAGLDGKIGGGWTWDAYYQFGRTKATLREGGILRPGAFAQAVDAVIAPNGQVVCRSALTNPASTCKPLNPFGTGSPSAESIDFVTDDGFRSTIIKQHAASLSVQGSPFATWAGPVSLALGADYRRESIDQEVDPLSQSNAFLIGNPKAFAGHFTVKEVFGEVVVPLLSDVPFAKSVELNLADRYADYSTTGGVNSWKMGLNYAVNNDLRFRATRSRDIRAPNLGEFFSLGGSTFANLRDPVTNTTPFVEVIRSPNPNLRPEKANTTTVGAVYQPGWLPGFQASIDYYRISIDGVISSIPAQVFIDACRAGSATLCAAITRNAQNQIVSIQAGRLNLAGLFTSGLDIEARYSFALANPFTGSDGRLTIQGLANYTDKMRTNDGLSRIDRAGQVGGNGFAPAGGKPHWMANGSISYETGPLSLNTTLRYVGGGVYDTTFGPRDINVSHFDGRTYTDIGFRYRLRDQGPRVIELFGRMGNVFDVDPPIIPNPDSLFATNSALYDTVGRTFQFGIRVKR